MVYKILKKNRPLLFIKTGWEEFKIAWKKKTLKVFFFQTFIFLINLLFLKRIILIYRLYVWNWFYNITNLKKNIHLPQFGGFLFGLFDFIKKFQLHSTSSFICFFFFILTVTLQSITLTKVLFLWLLGFGNIYWLFSTFTFFIKKYYYAKFTSANQKFWKRALILFWVLEFFLFSIFLFLTFNANNESNYMLDNQQLFKLFLTPLSQFIILLVFASMLVIFCYLFLLSLKWQTFDRLLLNGSFLSGILFFFSFFECYQFFHVINYYSNIAWEYDFDIEVWVAELEARKTRTRHHYVLLLCILKFWHIIFICGVWIFFFFKALEIFRIRYQSVASNLHNFVFLYIFCWIFLFSWLRFLLKYIFTYTFDEFYIFGHSYVGFFFIKDLSTLSFSEFLGYSSYGLKSSFFYFDTDKVLHSLPFYSTNE